MTRKSRSECAFPATIFLLHHEIYLTGWDAKALATVLNVIHGRNAQVPRNVNFEFLTQVAAVVHHLECAEAVQLLSSFWLSTLEEAAVSC